MDAPRRRIPLFTALLAGCLVGPALAAGLHWGVILGTLNSGEVLPGHVYRSAQPDARALAWLVKRYGIRTVINLRGHAQAAPWYLAEAGAGADLGLSHEDITMSASRLPSPHAVRQLVEALDRSPRPVLLHCQQGVDRTGLAAVSAVLLHSDTPVEVALRSMSLGTGHVPLGRTRFIGRFFAQYREWLAGLGLAHTPASFRLWATRHYAPEGTPAEWVGTPVTVRGPALVTARCRNLSGREWRFRPEPRAGVHAVWHVVGEDGSPAAAGITGLRDAAVAPGGEIGLGFALPRLAPGRYRLRAELVSEHQATFTQLGSPPLDIEVTVPPDTDEG